MRQCNVAQLPSKAVVGSPLVALEPWNIEPNTSFNRVMATNGYHVCKKARKELEDHGARKTRPQCGARNRDVKRQKGCDWMKGQVIGSFLAAAKFRAAGW